MGGLQPPAETQQGDPPPGESFPAPDPSSNRTDSSQDQPPLQGQISTIENPLQGENPNLGLQGGALSLLGTPFPRSQPPPTTSALPLQSSTNGTDTPPALGLPQRALPYDPPLADRPRLRRRGFKPPLIPPPSNGIEDVEDLSGKRVERSTPTAGQIPVSSHDRTQEKQGVIDAHNYESPRALHPVPGSSVPVNFNVPTWKRLCSSAFPPPELISLAEAIFMSKDEVKVICNLRGDDAQSFIDAAHKVRLRIPLWVTT